MSDTIQYLFFRDEFQFWFYKWEEGEHFISGERTDRSKAEGGNRKAWCEVSRHWWKWLLSCRTPWRLPHGVSQGWGSEALTGLLCFGPRTHGMSFLLVTWNWKGWWLAPGETHALLLENGRRRGLSALSGVWCLCVCVQVHFNHSGPGYRRHEQEGATGDPEEVRPCDLISLRRSRENPMQEYSWSRRGH